MHLPSGDRARSKSETRNQHRPCQRVKEAFMDLESQWTVYRTRFLVRARQLTEPLVFTDALGREQSGLPGDYLVESSGGINKDNQPSALRGHLRATSTSAWSAQRPRPARIKSRTRG